MMSLSRQLGISIPNLGVVRSGLAMKGLQNPSKQVEIEARLIQKSRWLMDLSFGASCTNRTNELRYLVNQQRHVLHRENKYAWHGKFSISSSALPEHADVYRAWKDNGVG